MGRGTIGEAVDHICLTPVGAAGRDVQRLYRRARRLQHDPLSFLAAYRLTEKVRAEDVVLLATGAGAPPELPFGETDGPLGTVILARALHRGLGARPYVLAEDRNHAPIQAVLEVAGEDYPIISTPCGEDFGRHPLLAELKPEALIAVEKLGPNPKGVIHDMRGRDTSQSHTSLRGLFDAAKERGILTLGIGDRGNEIGFGLLFQDASRPVVKTGRCQCPCLGGIACDVQTDLLVVSSLSNWGAYGVVRCLEALTGRRLLHDPMDETAMLQAAVGAGARDGVTRSSTLTVDGTSLAVQQAVLTLLNAIR